MATENVFDYEQTNPVQPQPVDTTSNSDMSGETFGPTMPVMSEQEATRYVPAAINYVDVAAMQRKKDEAANNASSLPWDQAPIGAEPSPEIKPGRADSPFNRLPPEMRASIMGGAAGLVAGRVPLIGSFLKNRVIAPAAIAFYKEDTKTPELPKN